MNHLSQKLFTLFSFFLAITIIGSWILSHLPLLQSLFLFETGWVVPLNRILPLIFSFVILILFYTYIRLKYKTYHISIPYPLFAASMSIIILTICTFNVAAYVRILYPLQTPILDSSQWFTHNIAFLSKLFLQLAWMSLFCIGTYAMGIRLSRYIPHFLKIKDTLLCKLTQIALGMWGWTTLIFVLGYTNLLSKTSITIVFILFLFLEFKTIKNQLLKLIRLKEISINMKSIRFWLLTLVFILLSITLIASLRATPAGFDDTTTYLNKAHLIAQNNSLIPGGTPFPFELLASVGYLFGGTAMFAFGNNIIYAVLSFLGIYGISKLFSSSDTAAIAASASWLFLPTTSEFLFRDIKPDLILFFLTTLSVWLFFVWIHKKKNTTPLYMSLFILGFAVSVKLNALFILASILLCILYMVPYKKWHISAQQKTKVLFVGILCFMTPLLMWSWYAIDTGGIYKITKYTNIISSHNETSLALDKDQFQKFGIDIATCPFNGEIEDNNRFIKKPLSFNNFLLVPWQITMNERGFSRLYVTEIGFIFLITGILFLFSLVRLSYSKKRTLVKDKKIIPFVIITTTYWILWLLFGRNIIWYGYSGFVFLCIMIPLVFLYNSKNKLFKIILYAAIAINILIMLTIRTAHFAHPYTLIYVAENIDHYVDKFEPITTILNSSEDTFAYLIEGEMLYYIKDNHERVIKDHYLDLFTCLDSKKDDVEILQHLQTLNIDYVVYNNQISSVGNNPTGMRRKEIVRFLLFAQKNLKQELITDDFFLFSVPK